MSWSKHTPEWSKGRSQEHNRPYWDGHMFIVVYLRARGFTQSETGRAIGVSKERVRQMELKAQRIVLAKDKLRTNILAD